MTYQIYRQELNMDDYFSNWDNSQYDELTAALKERIYSKYLIKSRMLVRDSFTCQNVECKYCKNAQYHANLTMHHVKFQKNGGKDSVRNVVTLCSGSHRAFHKAVYEISFSAEDYLPSNIRGHTFKLDKKAVVNMKQIRAEMKLLRKGLKDKHGVRLSWEQVKLLLKFLELDFDNEDD